MGAVATQGGAAVASGTLNATHAPSGGNVSAVSKPGAAVHTSTQSVTTYSHDVITPATVVGKLLDELRQSLHLTPAVTTPLTPRAPKPLVSTHDSFQAILRAAQPIAKAPVAKAADVVQKYSAIAKTSTGGGNASPVAPAIDVHEVNLSAPLADQSLTPVAGSTPVTPANPIDVTPLAFIWNKRYFQLEAPANPTFDPQSEDAVKERAVRSTIKYLLEEEQEDDFGVDNVTVRPVSADLDADLLRVNANARWVSEVSGTSGTGTVRSFPVVLNFDGHTFVDPRVKV